MFYIVVRARSDAAAVSAMTRNYYPGWEIPIYTLKGERSPRKMLDILKEVADRPAFYLVLLGLEDKALLNYSQELPPKIRVHVVPRRKVRNARLSMLFREVERGKSRFRCTFGWREDHYVPEGSLGIDPHRACDPFIGLGAWQYFLAKHLPLSSPPLLVKRGGGLHDVYQGPHRVGWVRFGDVGPVIYNSTGSSSQTHIYVKTVRERLFRVHEEISMAFLKQFRDKYDRFFVPWSGGKDSTVALHMAIRVFGAKRVTPIFVDTGTEFLENKGYVDRVERILGVKVERVYAGIDRLILEKGLPTNKYRWCTQVKIGALRRAITRLGSGVRFLEVVGDRDAESPLRGKRAPYRSEELYMQVAPLKLWGMIHAQTYLTYYGIPHNPLYLKGFYRIGCVMCPAMRNWEHMVIESDEGLRAQANKYAGLSPHM